MSQWNQHQPDPAAPVGGVRRAIPRDALTGEPIRPDTLHIRVRGYPDRQSHDHSPIIPVRRHLSASKRAALRAPLASSSPLPVLRLPNLLDETLDEALDEALTEAVDGQASDD